ncbi:SpoIIE family protein phosphatase [Saccharothrix longispora]|uniref:histidine kinase n=1 Tax=Saccharothrix longispora TaxID=33920 RepID=A0ABU1PRC9_9PSEU|nr:SpoIIE family protein phosphatase [Saccharothrix longispora]MDR6593197.1 PAS domain S-box-containing protein [Saccharothrix longispora]
MPDREPHDAELLFPGGSEMAARMRAHRWPDGADPGTWPAALRTAVRICLTSRFPMIVWWGEELLFLHNDAYRPMLGDKHPALGKPGEQVWPEIWHTIGPMLRSVMDSGEATWSEDLPLSMARHGYWEETYWTYSYSPLHDDDGVVRGVFTAVSETTERVVGERRLAVLQDLGALAGKARSAVEACGMVARVLGRSGRDVPFAALHLVRDGEPEQVATSPAGVHVDQPWPIREVLATGRSVVLRDLPGDLPSGDWRSPPTEAVVLPLPGDAGGGPVGAIVLAAGAARALDEPYESFLQLVARQTASLVNGALAYEAQQRRAEELAELDRAKTAFFSNISHEFRTPLTLIMGPVQDMRERLPADDPARAELDAVHRNGLRLGKLVNTLLDFSRIEAGRMRARYEPVDLAAFTTELASVFRSAVERAGLRFEVDCAPLDGPVHVDRELWEKVVLNLLSNALKFTFEGSVRVALRQDGDHAVLTVADTGVGIPEAEMPRLFERFHRIGNARARSYEGSGIGLALVRELVGLHGGTIGATGAEGEGTTFTVRLPLGQEHLPADDLAHRAGPAVVSATAEPFVQEAMRWLPADDTGGATAEVDGAVLHHTPAGGDEAPAHVLVVDDNADMRDYLRRLLAPGYRVTTAADGEEALDAVRAAPPDLVVSDVMMPRLDGLGLVAALRADPRTAGVPVLLLSARAGQEASIEGLDAGADDYLVKPFSAAGLLARVRATVQLARLRNHHAAWRAALIDSLQEGFFVCDERGAVVEINAAFTDILGYGPDGLPYPPPHPWWLEEGAETEALARADAAVDRMMEGGRGIATIPVTHRDGHRLWVAAAFSRVKDPDTGRQMIVGTFRDVTAQHYAVQRDLALAALSMRLAGADSVGEAVRGAVEELASLWGARRVLAVAVAADPPEVVASDGPADWDDLPPELRRAILDLGAGPALTVGGARAAGIALDHPGGALVLWVDLGGNRPCSAEDRTLLALLAGHLAQGLRRVHRIDQQRETALALQRAILGPSHLPEGFAVRYEPATRPLKVGGDWYDTIGLPDGRIGIVVGDCVGHGLEAATVMGQLRSACRALLLRDPAPAQALSALDVFAATLPGALSTTVFCAVLDPATGELVYSAAGHPPGVLVHRDGGTDLLEGGRSIPLAVRPDRPRTEARTVVRGRSTLVLYTDGLVERRRRGLDDGIDDVCSAVRAARTAPVDDLATRLMTDLAPPGGFEDDVALLVYRHPAPLAVDFPADTARLAPVRHALRAWLRGCELTEDEVQNVLIAAGEACANAVEHAYPGPGGGVVRLRVALTGDGLRLTVTDGGRWRAPRENTYRGRGIPLIRALMQDVAIHHGADGTTVEMHTRIS